jgi:hypothetical protein
MADEAGLHPQMLRSDDINHDQRRLVDQVNLNIQYAAVR